MKIFEVKPDESVYCPFCEHVVFLNDGESEPEVCPHTLLIATDLGIAFCSDTLDAESLEDEAAESSWADVVSEIDKPEAVLIEMYEEAPEFFGAFYLFEE
ncbi:hypothetical protein [Desulfosediminicola flagellatus]|uniref:hypothetical protein n=1 Tax=Desulfosediminicola flagellatus TaxID=2569541 RepID=UPI0010AB9E29|nr:hypothetical protein [Desulfosediminicola flagellatus]